MTDESRSRGGVFISYRRVDASPWALRVADHLTLELGSDQVFVDIDALDPGVDFAEVIDATLSTCPVCLVMIGRQWLTVESTGGGRRIDDPGDLVRLEVTNALQRAAVVIPVLVDGARLPVADELPEPLRALTRKVPVDLAAKSFDRGMLELMERLHGLLAKPKPPLRRRVAVFLGGTSGLVSVLLVTLALVSVCAKLLIHDG